MVFTGRAISFTAVRWTLTACVLIYIEIFVYSCYSTLKQWGANEVLNRIIFDEFIITGVLLLPECINSLSHMTRPQFVA